MTATTFDLTTFDVQKFDSILARGLSHGKGDPNGQMCIEAAICNVLGMPHDDDPKCVAKAVRSFKIGLNDKKWSSPEARAKGLRDLGLAQLGSLGVVNDKEFVVRLAKKLIQIILPKMVRQCFASNVEVMRAADVCEVEGSQHSAIALRNILRSTAAYAAAAAAYAAAAAADAAYAAAADADAAYAYAAYAYAYAADAAAPSIRDEYLTLAAQIALDVLRELNSPGIQLLEVKAA